MSQLHWVLHPTLTCLTRTSLLRWDMPSGQRRRSTFWGAKAVMMWWYGSLPTSGCCRATASTLAAGGTARSSRMAVRKLEKVSRGVLQQLGHQGCVVNDEHVHAGGCKQVWVLLQHKVADDHARGVSRCRQGCCRCLCTGGTARAAGAGQPAHAAPVQPPQVGGYTCEQVQRQGAVQAVRRLRSTGCAGAPARQRAAGRASRHTWVAGPAAVDPAPGRSWRRVKASSMRQGTQRQRCADSARGSGPETAEPAELAAGPSSSRV